VKLFLLTKKTLIADKGSTLDFSKCKIMPAGAFLVTRYTEHIKTKLVTHLNVRAVMAQSV
jgi:hypothetical protein